MRGACTGGNIVEIKDCLIRSAATGLLIAATQVIAAPPMAYDAWTITAGAIDANALCTGDISCKTLSSDDGFLQQQVSNSATGTKYIRVIMTDAGGVSGDPTLTGASADLAFATETYTPYLTNSECNTAVSIGTEIANPQDCQGIAAKQVVRDLSRNFESIADIQRNFAKSAEGNTVDMYNVDLYQSISEADFFTDFTKTNYSYWECGFSGCNNNTVIGGRLDINAEVLTGDPGDTTTKQKFAHRVREGWQGRQSGGWFMSDPVTTPGSLTLGGVTVDYGQGGGGFGPAPADDIVMTWLAENNNGFAYQSVENLSGTSTTGNNFAEERLLININDPSGPPVGTVIDPFDWDPTNFGAAPSLP